MKPLVFIYSVPRGSQRDPRAIGDYWTADGRTTVLVTEMPDWRYEFLIALHELIEEALTRHRGIPEPCIMKFDLASGEDDPGMDPAAPYHQEHFFATAIEMLVAQELQVNWREYERICEAATLPASQLPRSSLPPEFDPALREDAPARRGRDPRA